jgi:hypothetical protein
MASRRSEGPLAVIAWRFLSGATGVLVGILIRLVLNQIWKRFGPSDHDPALNPADRRTSWAEALIWSVAAGVGVGVARVVGERLTAEVWELATGEAPPGVEIEE